MHDVEDVATVSNVAVNSAAVVVEDATTAVLQRRLQSTRTNKGPHSRTARRLRPRRQRSVHYVYRELGSIYFRRAYDL